MKINYKNLRECIKLLRKFNNLTQEEFATKCGVSRAVLSQVELGDIKPSLDLLLKVKIDYGISLDDLVTGKITPFNLRDSLEKKGGIINNNEEVNIPTIEEEIAEIKFRLSQLENK